MCVREKAKACKKNQLQEKDEISEEGRGNAYKRMELKCDAERRRRRACKRCRLQAWLLRISGVGIRNNFMPERSEVEKER